LSLFSQPILIAAASNSLSFSASSPPYAVLLISSLSAERMTSLSLSSSVHREYKWSWLHCCHDSLQLGQLVLLLPVYSRGTFHLMPSQQHIQLLQQIRFDTPPFLPEDGKCLLLNVFCLFKTPCCSLHNNDMFCFGMWSYVIVF
jgi:hypothetical protein